MGVLDLFKATENANLKQENAKLKELLNPDQKKVFDLNIEIEKLESTKKNILKDIDKLSTKCNILETEIQSKKSQLIELDDDILYQSFSLYKPLYDFATSEQYKDRLEEIRDKQKKLIKTKTACSFSTNWTVDGSISKGKKMINDNIKQILRSFNTECDNIIDKVKFNNINVMKTRIQKSFEILNSLNSTNKIAITQNYLNLKLEEVSLAYEYQCKKQDEKEEQRRIREELKEQERVKKEIEEARKKIYKDKEHNLKALADIEKKLKEETDDDKITALLEKKKEIEIQLTDIEHKLADIDYRESNQKAGYVYIISNIGSFGENIYKIGMTRRLEPEERIRELSDASVPFNFDIHALIFTEDAPALESALHKAFEKNKVNMINKRREFFNVSLDEIKDVINQNYDKTVDFIINPPAEQYRESQKILENINNSSIYTKD